MLTREMPVAGPLRMAKQAGIYCLYGLRIASAVPLPCPELQDPAADADVELIEVRGEQLSEHCKSACTHSKDSAYWRDNIYEDGSAHVLWKEHFEFLVSGDGSRVLWQRAQEVSDEVVFTYLLGHVMSYCLLARGIEPLHATSVLINGSAIALLGNSGYGKSTMAAALLERGYPLITDDVLVLEFKGQEVLAHPSLPRIKLLPESADAFLQGKRSMPMNKFTHKMIFPLKGEQHIAQPVPLAALYLIPPRSSHSSKITIRRTSGRASFLPIIQNTFNTTVRAPLRLKRQFEFANRLITAVPVKRMSYPKRLELLPAVIDAILADLSRGTRSARSPHPPRRPHSG